MNRNFLAPCCLKRATQPRPAFLSHLPIFFLCCLALPESCAIPVPCKGAFTKSGISQCEKSPPRPPKPWDLGRPLLALAFMGTALPLTCRRENPSCQAPIALPRHTTTGTASMSAPTSAASGGITMRPRPTWRRRARHQLDEHQRYHRRRPDRLELHVGSQLARRH